MAETGKEPVRLDFLDIAKAFAIWLVVLGHCADPFAPVSLWTKIIYSFHMPLFFMVSGVTAHGQKAYSKEGFCRYLKKNFFALLVPYFVWNMIYMPFGAETIGRILYGTTPVLLQSGARNGHMWYLPCFFLAKIGMYFVLYFEEKTEKKKCFLLLCMAVCFTVGFLLPAVSMQYPWSLNIAFVALAFMIGGRLLSIMMFRLDAMHAGCQLLIAVAAAALLYVGNVYGDIGVTMVNMCYAMYGAPFWFVFNAFAGILMVRSLSSVIARISLSSRLAWIRTGLTRLGQETMGVYLVHMPMNVLILMPFLKTVLPLDWTCFGSFVLLSAVILTVSIVITLLINRVFPQMFGRGFDVK